MVSGIWCLPAICANVSPSDSHQYWYVCCGDVAFVVKVLRASTTSTNSTAMARPYLKESPLLLLPLGVPRCFLHLHQCSSFLEKCYRFLMNYSFMGFVVEDGYVALFRPQGIAHLLLLGLREVCDLSDTIDALCMRSAALCMQ